MKKLLMAFATAALLTACFCVPAFALTASDFVPNPNIKPHECPYLYEFGTSQTFDSDVLMSFYDSETHYLACLDCGAFVDTSFSFGEQIPHTGTECFLCLSFFETYGCGFAVPFPVTSSGIVSSISPLVTNAIDWVSLVSNCIVEEPLLLLFVCVSFVGIGIGFIKRIIHL